MMTVAAIPHSCANPMESAAPVAGALSAGVIAVKVLSNTAAAPSRNAVGSNPAIIMGNKPTTDKTAYRPPTRGSWSSMGMSYRFASTRKGLVPVSSAGTSVIATTWLRNAPFPKTAPIRARQIVVCIRVSAVPPDFEIVNTPVRVQSRAANNASNVCGSTLSMKCRRGVPCGGPHPKSARAYRLLPPRLDPPVPSTMTSSKLSRNRAARGVTWSMSSCR